MKGKGTAIGVGRGRAVAMRARVSLFTQLIVLFCYYDPCIIFQHIQFERKMQATIFC